MSDKYKLFEKIYEPDIRQSYFVVYNSDTYRKITIEDLYNEISEIALNSNVPEEIKVNFDIARNIMLYSWFVYRFMTVAELQAFCSLEMALRVKFGYDKSNSSPGMASLLKKSIKEKIVTDIQIRNYQRIQGHKQEFEQSKKSLFEVMGQSVPESSFSSPSDPQGFCKILCDTFPRLRNSLAHGSNSLSAFHSLLILEFCCDLINQLFP